MPCRSGYLSLGPYKGLALYGTIHAPYGTVVDYCMTGYRTLVPCTNTAMMHNVILKPCMHQRGTLVPYVNTLIRTMLSLHHMYKPKKRTSWHLVMMICAKKPNRILEYQENLRKKSYSLKKFTENQRFIAKPCYQ